MQCTVAGYRDSCSKAMWTHVFRTSYEHGNWQWDICKARKGHGLCAVLQFAQSLAASSGHPRAGFHSEASSPCDHLVIGLKSRARLPSQGQKARSWGTCELPMPRSSLEVYTQVRDVVRCCERGMVVGKLKSNIGIPFNKPVARGFRIIFLILESDSDKSVKGFRFSKGAVQT